MIFNIFIAVISIISLLVIHELGHFLLAKRFGVKVEEFGIGYPPRLFGKKFGETLYSINLLPFGALVKIPGTDGDDSHVEESRRYTGKPAWQKALILIGGVVSFWIVAVILLSIVFGMGAPQAISDEEAGPLINPQVQILGVAPDSPAQIAGLRAGDTIKEFSITERRSEGGEEGIFFDLNSKFTIDKVKEVQELTAQYQGQEITLTIQRGKEVFTALLVPRVSPPEGEGAMGVALVRTALVSYPWWSAPVKGITATANLTFDVIIGLGSTLGNLIQGKGLPQGAQLVGPIGLGTLITQAAQVGVNYFLQFIAIIAIYLAVFNLLPIPALDGGKLLFLAIEKIQGKAIPRKIEEGLTTAFFGLLILLMIFITFKDIARLF